jgi:Fur family transcriptional regulator, peroxide stress response regulator
MNKKNTVSLDSFMEKCRELNFKITPQRIAIYKEVANNKEHPSIDKVFRKVKKVFPHISFDTVYRTLQSFADAGIVRVVEGYGQPKRFDADIENHHHMHCIKCNAIIDFYNERYDNIEIPKEVKKKFHVVSKKVILEGLCNDCKSIK